MWCEIIPLLPPGLHSCPANLMGEPFKDPPEKVPCEGKGGEEGGGGRNCWERSYGKSGRESEFVKRKERERERNNEREREGKRESERSKIVGGGELQ